MRPRYEASRPPQQEAESQSLLDQAYEKAKAVFADSTVNMDDFKSLYPPEMVERDKQKAAELESKFERRATPEEKKQKQMATVLEAMFHDQSRNNEWLGKGVSTIRPGEYDDFINGVDSIVEYKGDGRSAFLAMAIDATYSSYTGAKFNRIRSELIEGKLGEVKYFKTDNFKGMLSGIPKVVVGASSKTLEEVMALWVRGDNEALRNHPIQTLILEQMVLQLEAFQEFCAKRKALENNAKVFGNYLTILKPILEEKKATVPMDSLKNDTVLNGIKGQLLGFNPPKPAPPQTPASAS